MNNIISFIGYHNSGKTTLVAQVVRHLKKLGYQVAVIKSSKSTGIAFDTPGTDTAKHRAAGADSVLLVAPDQMVLLTENQNLSISTLAQRYFSDADIIIGEGFKNAKSIAKIEVVRDPNQTLRKEVSGVIAVATDQDIAGDYVFKLDQSAAIASFIEKRFLQNDRQEPKKTTLLINGEKIPLEKFAQDSLANTVADFIETLKLPEKTKEIELRLTLDK